MATLLQKASKPGVTRLPLSKANIPKIPVQPISYGEAYHLLSAIEYVHIYILQHIFNTCNRSNPAPAHWKGGINNLNYSEILF